MKGIVLAGGRGTRLYPMTRPCCKPLLPIYDKPMIYYPISTLMMAGIRDILVIVPPGGEQPFRDLLGDGSRYGISISYRPQPQQRGIADALLVGADFIGSDRVCLILGDNIFHGPGFQIDLDAAMSRETGATVFGYYVEDPRAFGVVEFDLHGRALSIEEKPARPRSHYIIPGLYFYDNRVVDYARQIEPSPRGELEITAVNNRYLQDGELHVIRLGHRFCWYDTGNAEDMFAASAAVRRLMLEKREWVGCLEKVAYEKGYIDRDGLLAAAGELSNTAYGALLRRLAARD